MEPHITLIALGVSDLDRDGLGLGKRDGPEGIALFETRGTWLSLYSREPLAEDAGLALHFPFAGQPRPTIEIPCTRFLPVSPMSKDAD